jgi:hypothetical protein
MTFNGTAWVNYGNPDFSPGSTYYTSLAFSGTVPYVAFGDGANGGKESVMMYQP